MVAPLTPSFKLDAEEARALVLPVTQRVKTNSSMDSSGAVDVNVLAVEGVAAAPKDANADATALLALEHLSSTIGNDPFLAYGAATALFQEVEMLEAYVKAATMMEKHVPYLVRMQVAIEPYRSRAAWDAYVDIEVKVGSAEAQDVEVIPLVASLNMESSARSVASRQLWSLAFGMQVLGSAVGIDAAKQRRVERSISRLGQDLNSVSIVSRKRKGMISVKLGARNSGKQERRQAAQIHSIAVLVLVPTNMASKPGARVSAAGGEDEIRSLNVSVFAHARNIHTGISRELDVSEAMTIALPPYSGAYVRDCDKVKDSPEAEAEAKAKTVHLAKYDSARETELRAKCVSDEHVTITGNAKQMVAVVPGIHDANATEMSAVLVAKTPDGKSVELRANQVTVDSNRRLTTFVFPAFSTYLGGQKPEYYTYELLVYHRGANWWSGGEQSSFPLLLRKVDIALEVKEAGKDSPTKGPALVLATDTPVVQRDDKGKGEVALQFSLPDSKDSLVPLELRISGAGLGSIPKGVLEEDDKGRIIVKKPGRVVLPLINLVGKFTMTTRELKEDGKGLVHEELEFTVNPR